MCKIRVKCKTPRKKPAGAAAESPVGQRAALPAGIRRGEAFAGFYFSLPRVARLRVLREMALESLERLVADVVLHTAGVPGGGLLAHAELVNDNQ